MKATAADTRDESAVVLTVADLRRRRQAAEKEQAKARREAREARLSGDGPRAREEVWREVAGRWRELEDAAAAEFEAEQERVHQKRNTTREDAVALVRRVDEAPYAEGSATSRAAAEEIVREAPNLDVATLVLLLANPYGLTDEQIGDRLGVKGDTARARRWTLSHKLGLAEDSGRTRPNEAGRDCTVWVAWKHADEHGKEVAA